MKSVRTGIRSIPALRSLASSRGLPEHTTYATAVSGVQARPRANGLATQAFPLTGFYQLLLEHPQTPSDHPAYYPSRAGSQPTQQTISDPTQQVGQEDQLTRAQLVFGSSLVGPRRVRTKNANDQAQIIAGVLVPPKPKEPDNCCMSGCVNCVWDVFREDLEEWAAANTRAQKALKRQSEGEISSMVSRDNTATSRGVVNRERREDNNHSKDQSVTPGPSMWEGLEGIPIGIRVFMDTEKAIKSRHSEKCKVASASGD
ncbi:uncharacterized protein DFL_001813 [Arthrobotrys flagrans]|uniref:Oxidoreductase-like domain-containing protein n=1 Tax=Arthrobotrys flagrans TaxID=97331 RepID=A0A437A8V4_ARTFL|nr:hypothetical protein DFL_001813 [Arthrobotrys flagrans]